VLLNQAGWHSANGLTVPPNLTLVPLPAYAPELNGIEKVWQYLRERSLSQRVFRDLGEISDVRCVAWNRLLAEPGRLRSLTAFPWLPACVTSS
jgi:transposase